MAVRTGEGNEKSIYKWSPIKSVSVYRYSKFAESEHKKKQTRKLRDEIWQRCTTSLLLQLLILRVFGTGTLAGPD
jgi:hypothetical protein